MDNKELVFIVRDFEWDKFHSFVKYSERQQARQLTPPLNPNPNPIPKVDWLVFHLSWSMSQHSNANP